MEAQQAVPDEPKQAQQAQQEGQDLNLEAQQAQQGLPAGGVLTKPKPVGIGHMCRAIGALTGGTLNPET